MQKDYIINSGIASWVCPPDHPETQTYHQALQTAYRDSEGISSETQDVLQELHVDVAVLMVRVAHSHTPLETRR